MGRLFNNSNLNAFILIIIGFILYFSLLDNWYAEFSGDDDWMVYENPHVFNLSPTNIKEYFTNFYRGQYSPINTLAYGIIYKIFGIDPAYFHSFSLILHIGNAVLVLIIVQHLKIQKGKEVLSGETTTRYSLIAFLTAFLFLIHPMQVESVVWISASKVLLYTFFFLSALILYLKYIADSNKWFYLLSIILFILSFGAKEQAVVFPIILLLIDWYLCRNLKNKRILLEKLPFFLLSILFGVISISAQQAGFSYKLEKEYYPLIDRVFLASYAFTEYLFKLIVPFKLSAWYRFPIAPGEALPIKYYFYPILILIIAYFLWKNSKHWVLFGFIFFFINIMLTLHIIPMARGVLIADRYVYLGSIGIFYILSSYIIHIYNKDKSKAKRRKILSFLAFYLIVLSGYTLWYIDHWNIV